VSTHVGIGFSQNPNPSVAAQEAATRAKIQTQQPTIDLAIILNTIHYHPSQTLEALQEILEEAKIIGCTTAGIILSEAIEMRGVAVVAVKSDELHFGISHIPEILSQDLRQAGNLLARKAMNDFGMIPRQGFLFFMDGLLKNSDPLIKGLQEVFGTLFCMAGAGSCDDFHFKKTYQYCQDMFLTNGACGLLIGGSLNFVAASRHGFRPLGRPRIVDRSQGNIIKTIDGKKAYSLYEEFLGEEASALRSKTFSPMATLYPLGIFLDEEKEYLLRNAVDILSDGSIVCPGEIPEGKQIHIMIGSKDSLRAAAHDCALEIQASFKGNPPKLVIIFESLLRYKLLGRGAYQEIQMIKEILGEHTPIVGMHSFGEVSPFHAREPFKKTHVQHETIVIIALG